MTTKLLWVPPVIMSMAVANNEVWLDGLEYQDEETSDPIDLTGIAFQMEMRLAATAATVVLRATSDNSYIRVGGNTWQLQVPADVMVTIPPATYVYDMLGLADGLTRRLARGNVTVELGVTRMFGYDSTMINSNRLAPAVSASRVRQVRVSRLAGMRSAALREAA
jgi:hypothetical protein